MSKTPPLRPRRVVIQRHDELQSRSDMPKTPSLRKGRILLIAVIGVFVALIVMFSTNSFLERLANHDIRDVSLFCGSE
jgi:hypothetical protein